MTSARSRRHALTTLGIQPGPLNYKRLAEACEEYGLRQIRPYVRDRERSEKRCGGCGRILPIESFALKDRTTGRRQARCRGCHSGLRRSHYVRNREKIKDQVAARQAEVRLKNMTRIVDYLLEHPCVDCGEQDPFVLQFDHVRGVKVKDVNRLSHLAGWDAVAEEIAKCDVRCANCHTRRTATQFGWRPAVLVQRVGHLPSKQA